MNALKLLDLFRKTPEKIAALRLYKAIVTQSREPGFYLRLGVPDTADGRFDMIALHAFLVLYRLKKDRPQTAPLTQALFDLMFADMDQNLREMGVGDLSVGKKIKKMAAAFQGRIVAYETALAVPEALEQALARNVYRHVEPAPLHVSALARYVRVQVDALDRQPTERFAAGEVTFPALEASTSAASETGEEQRP